MSDFVGELWRSLPRCTSRLRDLTTSTLSRRPASRAFIPRRTVKHSSCSTQSHSCFSTILAFSSMSHYKLDPCGLPAKDYLRSFWLSEPTSLQNHRTSPELPSAADVIVIGSGISGTLMAYNLLQKQPGTRIVMLDAREVCGGATGRNGGQIKTDVSS